MPDNNCEDYARQCEAILARAAEWPTRCVCKERAETMDSMSPLSEAAKHILVALSHGELLRVARDGSAPGSSIRHGTRSRLDRFPCRAASFLSCNKVCSSAR